MIKIILETLLLIVYLLVCYVVYVNSGIVWGILFGLVACLFICSIVLELSQWRYERRMREEGTGSAAKAKQANTEVAPWTWGRDVKEDTPSDYATDLWAASAYQCRNIPREGSKSTPKSSPVQVGSRTKWETKETK